MKNLLALASVATIALSGCVSVLPDPDPAPVVYRLQSRAQPAAPVANPQVIRIDRPIASQIYNSNDIVVSMSGQNLSAVAQANWSDAMPSTVQSAFVDAVSASGQFTALLPSSGARADTRLNVTIQNFEANFDQGEQSAPLAIVQYRIAYTRADDRELLGTLSVRKTQRAASINVSSIVAAIETANEAAMADVVAWLERTPQI